MKPIYFPFTFISQPAGEALRACFRRVVVYQPSRKSVPEGMQIWEKEGLLDIRVPATGDEGQIDAICRDYRIWLDQHQGSDIALLKAQGNSIPFFDESYASQIKKDVLKNGRASESQGKPDFLLLARIFLQTAQELDAENWGIDQDLVSLEKMERDLLNGLRGEGGDSQVKSPGEMALNISDSGDYMTKERIQAWARLFLHDQSQLGAEASGVFITNSRSVLEYLIDVSTGAETILSLDAVPVQKNTTEHVQKWQDGLMETLVRLVKNKETVVDEAFQSFPDSWAGERTVALNIYVIPGETPRELFARCVNSGFSQPEEDKVEKKINNTLLGLIS